MADLVLGIDARGARRGAGEFNRATSSISRGAKILTGVLASLGAVLSVREFFNLSDAFVQVNNRIRLVTKSSEEFASVQARLLQQSKDNFQAFESQAEVFQRVAKGAGEAGLSTEEALKATEAVAAAIRLSGVSAEAARNAVVQFGQGLAAGALRGDELRSVLEQTPALAQAVATAMGTTVGQLRAFGEAGLITTEKVIPGLADQLEQLKERTLLLNPTFSQAFENLRTATVVAIGDFNAISDTAGTFTSILGDLAGVIEREMPGALLIFGNEFAVIFDFVKEGAIGMNLAFGLISDAINSAAGSTDGLADTLGQLVVDTIPNAIALIKIFSTELIGLFAQGETTFNLLRKNFELADAQRSGNKADAAALRKEIGELNSELQREKDFRLANITAILGERQANIDNRDAVIAAAEAERKARADALKNLDATKGRAGGFDEDAPSAIGKISKELQKLLDKTRGPFGDFIVDFDEFQEALAKDFPNNFAIGVEELLEKFAGSTGTLSEFRAALNLAGGAGVKEGSVDFLDSLGLSFDELQGRLLAFQMVSPASTVTEFLEALELADEVTLETATVQVQLNEAMKDYQTLLDAGLISQDTFNKKQQELKEDLTGLTDTFKNLSEAAAKNIQGAFADFLFDPFEEGLAGMARGFLDTMRKIVAEIIANAILKQLFTSLANSGGGAVAAFGNAALGALGNRAGGGPVAAGQSVIVGEREPEVFTPRQSGTVLNGDQMAGLTPNITNNVIIDPRGFTQALQSPQGSRDLIQAIQVNKRAIQAAMQ